MIEKIHPIIPISYPKQRPRRQTETRDKKTEKDSGFKQVLEKEIEKQSQCDYRV